MPPITANGQESRRSVTPVPQRHGTEPAVSGTPPTTYPLRPVQSSPQFPVPQTSFQSLGSHPASSNLQQGQNSNAADGKALCKILAYPEGEIPVSVWSIDDARLTIGCLSRLWIKMMLTPGR